MLWSLNRFTTLREWCKEVNPLCLDQTKRLGDRTLPAIFAMTNEQLHDGGLSTSLIMSIRRLQINCMH